MRRRKEKDIIIVMMLVCVLTMSIGYALLSQTLNINGTAKVESTWSIKITSIINKATGSASNKVAPTYTDTTATFNTDLVNPGDKMEYTITVSNLGTLDAIIESVNLNVEENPAINYTIEGIERGYTLTKDESIKFRVTVEYNPDTTTQPEKLSAIATVTVNTVQLHGSDIDVVEKPTEKYIVTFNPGTGTVNPTSKEVTVGKAYGTLPIPTKPSNVPSSYRFKGWYTSESGGIEITSSTVVGLSSNQMLYARWGSNLATAS